MFSPSLDTLDIPSHSVTPRLGISSHSAHALANSRRDSLSSSVPSVVKVNRRIIRVVPGPNGGPPTFQRSQPLRAAPSQSSVSLHSPSPRSTAPLRKRASVITSVTTIEDKHGTVVPPFRSNPYNYRDSFQWMPTSPSQLKPETERGEPTKGFPSTCPKSHHSLSYSQPSLSSPDITSLSDVNIGHALRKPPINPRKSRRYCTDFGLRARCAPLKEAYLPPPFLLQTSLPPNNRDGASVTSGGSTPLATYTETNSDTSSLYQDIELEFPNPPSSHPALRRMQSSPLFTLEQTSAVREFLRKRWSTKVKAKESGHSNMGVSPVLRPIVPSILDGPHEKWNGPEHVFSWGAETSICKGFGNGGYSEHGNANYLASELALESEGEALLRMADIRSIAGVKNEGIYRNNRSSRVPEGRDVKIDDVSHVLRSLRTGAPGSCEDAAKRRKDIQGLGVPLDFISATVEQVARSEAHSDSGGRDENIAPINLAPSTSQIRPSTDRLENAKLSNHKYGWFTPSHPTSRVPRIIRKVASMRFSPKQHDDRSAPHSHRLAEPMSVKFIPDPSNAFDRLELNTKKLKTYQPPLPHTTSTSCSFACGGMEFQPSDAQEYSRPPLPLSLASAGRRRPSHRPHLSVPLAGLGFSNSTSDGNTLTVDMSALKSPRVLGAPFMHRTTHSQPLTLNSIPSTVTETTNSAQVLRSFIDLTPEQKVRRESSAAGVSKERVRKLLARASNGVIGWGRNLTKKRSLG